MKAKFGNKSKSYEDIHHACTIRFLDDSEPLIISYQKKTRGLWLIDYVCKELNLVEKDYFGLRIEGNDKQRHWLDPIKSIYQQLKNVKKSLCFRVKFYPSEPGKLKEEITRYFLFLQLRRDLHHGRLLCNFVESNILAAHIIQSELGDFDPIDHLPDYVAEFKILPKQTQKQADMISELHKALIGQTGSDSELEFLKRAALLDTFGVDPYPVKDQKGSQMYLGITHLGISSFQGNKRTHLFKWSQINKITFEGKMFVVHVTVNETKHVCSFKCPTFSVCKHLWKCGVEQQYFFTLNKSSEAPKVKSGGGFFRRGSKFRFRGRCQSEAIDDSSTIKREPPAFTRTSSNPQLVKSYYYERASTLLAKLKRQQKIEVAEKNHASTADISNYEGETGREEKIQSLPQIELNPESQIELNPESSESCSDALIIEEKIDETLVEATSVEGTLVGDTLGSNDLDVHIEDLQMVLEIARAENSNHIPPSEDPSIPISRSEEETKPNDFQKKNEFSKQLFSPKEMKTKSLTYVICKNLIFSLGVVLVMYILFILVLETDLPLPKNPLLVKMKGIFNY